MHMLLNWVIKSQKIHNGFSVLPLPKFQDVILLLEVLDVFSSVVELDVAILQNAV